MLDKRLCNFEFAVEVKGERGFVRQLDVFPTCEAAKTFLNDCNDPLLPGEHLDVTCIEYDQYGNELRAYSVV